MLNLTQKVSKNIILNAFGTFSSRLIQFGLFALFARYLGEDGFGSYNFILAFISLFAVISDFGMSSVLMREIAKEPHRVSEFLSNGILFRIFFSATAFIAAIAVASIMDVSIDNLLIYLFAITLFFYPNNSFRDLFAAKLKMEFVAISEIISILLFVIIALLIVWLKGSLVLIIMAHVFSITIGFILLALFARREVKLTFRVNREVLAFFLREGWPLALSAMFVALYARIDQIMLFQMKNSQAVGLYSSVVRITELPGFLAVAFVSSITPVLSRTFIEDKKTFDRISRLTYRYLTIGVTLYILVVSLLSEYLLAIIFGERYVGASPTLIVLIWSSLFIFLGMGLNTVLICSNLQRTSFILTAACAIINMILNFFLIPLYGILGAALATVISYATIFPVAFILPSTRNMVKDLFSESIKPIVAIFVIVCIGWILHVKMAGVVMFLLVYLFFIYKVLGHEDFTYFRKLIKKSSLVG